MKVLSTTALDHPFFHLFLLGAPGAGKTKLIGDFHEAGQPVVIVSVENDRMTLPALGIHVPILVPESENDLRAIVEVPEQVIERVVRKIPGFAEYEPKTFAFDNLRLIQRVVFGEGPRRETELASGVVLPKRDETGIMAMPNKRDASGIPANKDYRLLDDRMRAFIFFITQMKYHTIVTTHEERDLAIDSKLKLTGDPEKDKLINRQTSGYPALEGFSLKYDLPGLISDYFLRLEWTGQNYFMHTQPNGGFHSRTRINQVMPAQIDWTGQNAYHILRKKYEQAQQKAAQKVREKGGAKA